MVLFKFPLTMFFLSRGVILLAMLGIAPLLQAPPDGIRAQFGWDVFFAWDSVWYQAIATTGYEYLDDGNQHSVAFFPLFPILTRMLMMLGLPFNISGILINNLAFLAALILLYLWLTETYSVSIAKWTIAGLAWCPFSLYGTVIYTEGLFLCLSILSLRSFAKQQYIWAAIWGLLTCATRITGLALIPAFLLTSWRKKQGYLAYLSSLVPGLFLIIYSLYCWLRFKAPFAFITVQKAWQPEQAFWGQGWLQMLAEVTIGYQNWQQGSLADIGYPIAFISLAILGYLVWFLRRKIGLVKAGYCFCVLVVLLWLLAGNSFINLSMVFAGAYLLWLFRKKLTSLFLWYGIFNLVILFASGRTASAERYVYGNISLSIALGILLSKYSRWGYPLIIFWGILLAIYSIRFAQELWVA